jgi:hypothetical protein
MKTLKLLALVMPLAFGATALADDEEKQEMRIVVETTSTDGGADFTWVSDDPGFDMENMQVGETQSIVDEAGRSVLITREVDGFRFDVDGETIVLPDMGTHTAGFAMIDGADVTSNVEVEIIGGQHAMATAIGAPNGVTIITGEALDDGTKESIKALLQSVGRGDDVTFIDGSGGAHDGHMTIVRKAVEITQ